MEITLDPLSVMPVMWFESEGNGVVVVPFEK